MNGFQMLRVHNQTGKFVLIQFQTKQYAKTHIINSCLHCAIHCLGMVIIIVLRTGRMELQIAFFMIGFLEQNVGTDSRFLQLAVIFHRGCGDIHIDAADRAVFVLYGIDRFNAIKNIFDRIIYGVFPCFDCKALMSQILKRNDFGFHFFLRQLFSCNMLVDAVIGAIYAAVDAVV